MSAPGARLASACALAFLSSCGALYFSTSNRDGRGRPKLNDDRILRLVPENSER